MLVLLGLCAVGAVAVPLWAVQQPSAAGQVLALVSGLLLLLVATEMARRVGSRVVRRINRHFDVHAEQLRELHKIQDELLSEVRLMRDAVAETNEDVAGANRRLEEIQTQLDHIAHRVKVSERQVSRLHNSVDTVRERLEAAERRVLGSIGRAYLAHDDQLAEFLTRTPVEADFREEWHANGGNAGM